VLVAVTGSTLLVATQPDGSISLLAASGPGSGKIQTRTPLSPVQHPTGFACAPHVCVTADETTRQVVVATF
jgi:hypothetical protein